MSTSRQNDSSSPGPGAELERRVGRLEFAEGALARLRVPLRISGDKGREILTDLDVLAVDIDSRLRTHLSVLECKTTKGQAGEPDRLFWLTGLQRLTKSQRAVLVRQTITQRGRSVARVLDLEIMDMATLDSREVGHAWVPDRFAHIDGPGCERVERRTDTQLKGLRNLSSGLVAFLRHDSLLADSSRCLNSLAALEIAAANRIVPSPTVLTLGGHALITLLLSAIRDASRLDIVPPADLRERVIRSVTVGDPDHDQALGILTRADELVQHQVRRIHDAYTAAGSARQYITVSSLRAVVAEPPPWVDQYIDFVAKLRANPATARDLGQTAELSCFDALCGDQGYAEPAFDHLFTPEHKYLMVSAIKALREIVGAQFADALGEIENLNFDRSAPSIPDRAMPPAAEQAAKVALARELRADG